MSKNPHFTPYKYTQDLIELREWFYDRGDGQDRRREAVSRVNAYMTKGHLAHSIEATSLITSIVLTHEEEKITDDSVLRLSYTMAIIKFVNGLLDPYQQSNYAIPLHTLANFLKLPSYFVELRHCGTHEFLPPLHHLRNVADKALEWLYEHYWLEIDKLTSSALPSENSIGEEDLMKMEKEIRSHVRVYKRLRKANLNKIYKYGDSSPVGLQYWGAVNGLKKLYLKFDGAVADALLNNKILILDEDLTQGKVKGMRLLYKPLLEEMGAQFVNELLVRLTALADLNAQAAGWLEYIITNALTFANNVKFVNAKSLREVITILSSKSSEVHIGLLQSLQDAANPADKQLIEDRIAVMQKFKVSDKTLIPSMGNSQHQENESNKRDEPLDDFASDLQNLRKRLKTVQGTKQTDKAAHYVLWKTKEDWKPTAFGVSI